MQWLEKRAVPPHAIARQRAVLALAMFACIAGAANADVYDFTYSDSDSNGSDAGSGTLTTTTAPNGWGDDSQLLIGGSLTITVTRNASLLPTGTYPLIPTAPGVVTTSGGGGFFVDGLIYPADDAATGNDNPYGAVVANPSYLTNNGLLFGTNGVYEINFFGNGSGDYGLYTEQGTPGHFSYGIQVNNGGVFALFPVPEPSSGLLIALGAVGLLGARRRGRKA